MKNVTTVLALLLVSCMTGSTKTQYDCVQKLKEKIQVGDSQSDAEQALDQCGFTHSFDQKTSTIYALRRGDKDGLVKQDWSANIKLDEGRRVTSVKVEKVFTGP